LEYLHAHDDRMVRIEDVAVEVDLHPGYLARAFREHIGMPIGAYAREIRLERAAADLSTTDDRILDIAIAAGFTDQSHLTRLFRRRFGVTPAQYRTTVR
jgi:transcriptional regulator GlxA family with amidase domain